jgi:SAM-dependent methyltransferase
MNLKRLKMIEIVQRIYKWLVPGELDVFPPLDENLEGVQHYLKGRILNAGSGIRDVSHLIEGELINQDLGWPGDETANLHIRSPLHKIPVESDYFDTILNIAVLEHVESPEDVLAEFFRVLKPGGHLILEVPFLQPEHKVPTDFQRYTKDGVIRLVNKIGFEVIQIKGLFSVYHTLYWQVFIWLHLKNTIPYLLMRIMFLRLILGAARKSNTYSDRLASGFQLLAIKPCSC